MEGQGNSKSPEYQFGVGTEIWKVNKEKAIVLAGGRALLMQLAHPKVAQAIEDSNFLRKHPMKRLMQTAEAGVDMIFDTEQNSQKVADRINTVHRYVSGILKEPVGSHPEGSVYSASDQKLLAWVAATLIDSSIVGYQNFVRPLTPKERDGYVVEGKSLFAKLNLKPESLPDTYEELRIYINENIKSGEVEVGKLAKELAPYALLSHKPAYRTLMSPLRLATAYTLPEPLAEQYGMKLPLWQEKLLSQAAGGLRKAVPYLPREIRFFNKYRDAKKSLKNGY
jgi:uncharacterized protein (DUF2236 family)